MYAQHDSIAVNKLRQCTLCSLSLEVGRVEYLRVEWLVGSV